MTYVEKFEISFIINKLCVQFMVFSRILYCFVAKSVLFGFRCFVAKSFCRDLRAIAWRKFGPKIVLVEKNDKYQVC